MAKKRIGSRSSKPMIDLDELGGSADGGLAIVDSGGTLVHMTPPKIAASLRFFVARVQLNEDGLPPRLAVTSALRGEGVTYVTRSLAAVMAYDSDHSVVIVDANWRTPKRPAAGGDGAGGSAATPDAPIQPGLADAVDGSASVDDIIQKTTNPRLSLVSAGEVSVARRPALVGSPVLSTVIDEISERFDLLLLDLPPVLSSSEAIKLSQYADAFVLVIQQGITLQSQVEAALEELPATDALGVVLNRFSSRIPRGLRRVVGG